MAIDGPRAQALGALANYTVRVTNHGDAPAPNAIMKVYYPRSADLVQASDPQPSSRNVPKPDVRDARQREDAALQQREMASSRQVSTAAKTSNPETGGMGQRQWELGTLQPGQTMEATFTLRPFEGGQLRQVAAAQYLCGTAQDEDLIAQTAISTQILTLPGLRLTVIDDQDPVPSGDNVTYIITVLNQGKAPARDIQITAGLPEALSFVSAGGTTSGKNANSEVTFEPVATLPPGDQAQWQLRARVGAVADQKSQT